MSELILFVTVNNIDKDTCICSAVITCTYLSEVCVCAVCKRLPVFRSQAYKNQRARIPGRDVFDTLRYFSKTRMSVPTILRSQTSPLIDSDYAKLSEILYAEDMHALMFAAPVDTLRRLHASGVVNVRIAFDDYVRIHYPRLRQLAYAKNLPQVKKYIEVQTLFPELGLTSLDA